MGSIVSSASCLELFSSDRRAQSVNKGQPVCVSNGTSITASVNDFKSVPPDRCLEGVNEYVRLMIEDLAAWLNDLYHIELRLDNFFESVDNGVLLCQHANNLQRLARTYASTHPEEIQKRGISVPQESVFYRPQVPRGTFLGKFGPLKNFFDKFIFIKIYFLAFSSS